MILAVVLSLLVLVGWSYASDYWFPTAAPQSQRVENGKVKPIARPDTDPAADGPTAIRARNVVLGESPRLQIRTDSLQGSINLKGARLDDLVLLRHRETIDPKSPPVRLLSPAGARDSYFADFGWVGEGLATPDANAVWSVSAPVLTPGKPVTLSWS